MSDVVKTQVLNPQCWHSIGVDFSSRIFEELVAIFSAFKLLLDFIIGSFSSVSSRFLDAEYYLMALFS